MSTLRQIQKLPNTNDATASELARVEAAAARCMTALGLRGYERIQTPLIEETELFLRKSGGELSSRLYDFEEPGGVRTSLRPEFTAPVIRYAIEAGFAESKICRYQYFGPVFRYATPEHPDGSKPRQFNQLGAELIGSPAPRADGEVIAMALEGLDALNVPSASIALGHVGLLRQLLNKFELSERASQFLLSSMGQISVGLTPQVLENATRLGFLDSEGTPDVDLPAQRLNAEAVLGRSLGVLGANAGSRTREEVIARLARKQVNADDPGKFRSALSMLADLVTISGSVESALADGRKLATKSGLDEKCFSLLEKVVDAAANQGVDPSRIGIRYGLARGVAYYTGMLFDIITAPDSKQTLGGGGRYDGLTRALGLESDIPALGFAYNFDAVVAAAPSVVEDEHSPGTVLVRPTSDDAWQAAAQVAADIRKKGRAAVVDSIEPTDEFTDVLTVDSNGDSVQGTGAGR